MSAKCELKAAAKASGRTRYVSLKTCSKGHGYERLVVNGACTECARIIRRESYSRIPGQRIAAADKARSKRAKDPAAQRQCEVRSKLKTQYGLTEAVYSAMFNRQCGRCAICAEKIVSRLDPSRRTYTGHGGPTNEIARVDHCHSTNVVRGLLCSNCNIGLGKFRDSETFLSSAIRYLRESATV